jgi:hypothetical protein
MSGKALEEVDPVTSPGFLINKADAVATAGSCFAQHIARTLAAQGFNYMTYEIAPPGREKDPSYGMFSARYGNIYTACQLLQLVQRVYGLFVPEDRAWRLSNGRLIDPFRPRIEEGGFADEETFADDQAQHFAAVRRVIEDCDVFIFTLGLTEGWRSTKDQAVTPFHPGVFRAEGGDYEFHNFSVVEVESDLRLAIELIRTANPDVRVILTVSPVSLIATYEDRHVLVSTVYSKSVLRVVADAVTRAMPNVAYFPSYEMITGPQAGRASFEDDLREVRPEAVARVMKVFSRHYLTTEEGAQTALRPAALAPTPLNVGSRASDEAEFEAFSKVICDEDAISASLVV